MSNNTCDCKKRNKKEKLVTRQTHMITVLLLINEFKFLKF